MQEKTIPLQFTAEETMALVRCVDEKRKAMLLESASLGEIEHMKAYYALAQLLAKLAYPLLGSSTLADWMLESLGISFTDLEDG